MTENRHGLIVDGLLTVATGPAEREAALDMIAERGGHITVGADKAYDVAEFVAECRALGGTPHVAQNTGRDQMPRLAGQRED